LLDLGIELAERLPERTVERVHGPVALRRRVLDLAVGALELDRRLGERGLALRSLLVDHAEADQLEVAGALAVDRLLYEQLERRLGALEREAARLELLQLLQQRRDRRLVGGEVDAEALR